MKSYSKPIVKSLLIIQSETLSSTFEGFDSFGSFTSANIESYDANSQNLLNFIK